MIIARDVAIEAGAKQLLTEASFSVHDGDKIGLVGPNGAGKTLSWKVISVPARKSWSVATQCSKNSSHRINP